MWYKFSQTYKNKTSRFHEKQLAKWFPLFIVSINSLDYGSKDCENLIYSCEIWRVKSDCKKPGIYLSNKSFSSSVQTVEVDQKSTIEKVNTLIAEVAIIPHSQSDFMLDSNPFVDDSNNYSDNSINEDWWTMMLTRGNILL